MARKAKEEYVVGILFPTKTQTTIKYVTSVQTEPKVAKWDDGKEAMATPTTKEAPNTTPASSFSSI